MSAEHFITPLTADMATDPDNHSQSLLAPSMSQEPRWATAGRINRDDPVTWACCHLYAEQVVQIAAEAVRDQPMEGSTGDHPDKRHRVAAILDRTAKLVRLLALDDAYDGSLDEERWNEVLAQVGALCIADVEKIPRPLFRHKVVGWQP